jgi:release factor glutamine methyltransferase
LALDGGPDGLDAYRALAPRIGKWLASRGCAFLEIGRGGEAAVRRILEAAGLTVLSVSPDLAGIPRCVTVANMSGDRSAPRQKTVGKSAVNR